METTRSSAGCYQSNVCPIESNGEVQWNLAEIGAPAAELSVKEDAIEIQDIWELDMGWA